MKKYGGKHSSEYSATKVLSYSKRKNRRIMAATVACAVMIPVLNCAQLAAGIVQNRPGYQYKPDTASSLPAGTIRILGPNEFPDNQGNVRYCIESDILTVHSANDWKQEFAEDFRIAGTLIRQHGMEKDDLVQASTAFAIHNHLDMNPENWKRSRTIGFENIDTEKLSEKADSLWNDARNNTPRAVTVQNEYTQGKRAGTLHISVPNVNGISMSGISVQVKSSNNLLLLNGKSNTFSGKTDKNGITVPWTAENNGNARIEISFEAAKIEHLYSPNGQDEVRSSENTWYKNDFSIEVEKTFQPTLSSTISKRQLRAGEKIDSTVTSGVLGKDVWPNNVHMFAQGYYFVGSADDILHLQSRKVGESARQYLDRLRSLPNVHQVAASQADFSQAAETQQPSVKRANGDIGKSDFEKAEPYSVTETEVGLFGTWVWTIDRDAQNNNDKEWLKDDVVHVFGTEGTTSVHQATVTSDAATNQPTVGLGTEIVNEITVNGLPETYGSFKGNSKYNFSGDEKAHIRVWWAGAGTQNPTKADNAQYMPGAKGEPTIQEPKEDKNHRLVGEWEVPAVNGVYKVGNGSITLRAMSGTDKSQTDPTQVASNVHIRADNNKDSGWYVFVYDFPGSSRAMAHKSAYDNLWSRTYVSPSAPARQVSVKTRVSESKVKSGEKFHDNARITGDVPKGSYVIFSAYVYDDNADNSSESSQAKSANNNADCKGEKSDNKFSATKSDNKNSVKSSKSEEVLPHSRVNITDSQVAASKQESITVKSADISLDREGTVYWKAEVYNAQNQPLATHVLGVEGETVQVDAKETASNNNQDEDEENVDDAEKNKHQNDGKDSNNNYRLDNELDTLRKLLNSLVNNKNQQDDCTGENCKKNNKDAEQSGDIVSILSKKIVDNNASKENGLGRIAGNDGNNSENNAVSGDAGDSNGIDVNDNINLQNTPSSLAVTGVSAMAVMLLAVLMLVCAGGLSISRVAVTSSKHGRLVKAPYGGVRPMRRRLV